MPIKKSRNRSPIESWPFHQFGFGKGICRNTTGFAFRPALNRLRSSIHSKYIARGIGPRDREGERAIVLMPSKRGNNAIGKTGNLGVLVGRSIQQIETTDAVFVSDEG